MERWAQALEDQLVKQNDTYSRCTSFLRTKLGGQIQRVKCGKCDAPTWIGALIKFPCECVIDNVEYEVEHTLCFDCLEDKLERHRGFLERERTNPAKRALYDKCLEAIVCCEECHTPAVISRKVGYEGGIQAEGGDEGSGRRRVRYMINQELTDALKDLWGTHSFYENQRRSPFSKFSRDKLLRFERPHISDEHGKLTTGERQELPAGSVWLEDWRVVANVTADEIQKKDPSKSASRTAANTTSGANNNSNMLGAAGGPTPSGISTTVSSANLSASFIGLSGGKSGGAGGVDQNAKDEVSQTVTDPSGWQYAFLWPVPDGYVKWKSQPTASTTFVRRRKKTRAFLKLTDELRNRLKEFSRNENAEQKTA